MPRIVAVLISAVLALSSLTAAAHALDIDVSEFTLDNGMQVVVIPDHRAPVVTHMVWYKVGAADEPQGQAGIAHFLEHLMFKGTKRYPEGAFSRIVRANGGEENAFTTQDYTAYFQRIAKDRLALVMELEADRMQNLTLTDENVLPERLVVQEERRQRIESEPGGQLQEQVDAALYTAHPYGKPVIGWMPEVAELTRQEALDFYADHYEPGNAILIVAGDVTKSEVEALARQYYGPLRNRRPVAPRVRIEEPPPVAERRVIMRDDKVNSPIWQRTYLAPAARHVSQREELALSLLGSILGDGSQSRLQSSLSRQQKLAAYAGAWYSADALDYGSFTIYAAPNPGVDAGAIETAVDAVLAGIRDNGITQDELDRSRNHAIADAAYLLDSQAQLARLFGTSLATGQSIADIMNWERDLATVTIDDVTRAAASVLNRNASVTGILLPASGS